MTAWQTERANNEIWAKNLAFLTPIAFLFRFEIDWDFAQQVGFGFFPRRNLILLQQAHRPRSYASFETLPSDCLTGVVLEILA